MSNLELRKYFKFLSNDDIMCIKPIDLCIEFIKFIVFFSKIFVLQFSKRLFMAKICFVKSCRGFTDITLVKIGNN